jgi:cyclopentanol dehydrogenase
LITDVQEEKLKTVAAGIRSQGGIAEYAVQDVSSEQSWIEVVQKAALISW